MLDEGPLPEAVRTLTALLPEEAPPEPPAVRSAGAGAEEMDHVGPLWHTTPDPEEGVLPPFSLSPRTMHSILEVVERATERRERERAAVPPVYDFGSHSCWSGDE